MLRGVVSEFKGKSLDNLPWPRVGIRPARPLLLSAPCKSSYRLLLLQPAQVGEQRVEADESYAPFVLSAIRDPNTFDRRLAVVQRRQDQSFELAAFHATPWLNHILGRQGDVARTGWKDELLILLR